MHHLEPGNSNTAQPCSKFCPVAVCGIAAKDLPADPHYKKDIWNTVVVLIIFLSATVGEKYTVLAAFLILLLLLLAF